jgi:hypothetical protein
MLRVGRNNVEIWDTFLWVPICFHKSFKTMTQVWSCSQQVLLDYPVVLDFKTRAPNQTLLVGRNIQCEYYFLSWSFNLEKKKAYDLYAYFGPCFLVVVNQPSNWSQVPMKKIPNYNVIGKWHWAVFTQTPFSHFWRFYVDLVIDFFWDL